MKTFVGMMVFIVVWMTLGNLAEHIFPAVYQAFPKQFSWVCWAGAFMFILSQLAQAAVLHFWLEDKE